MEIDEILALKLATAYKSMSGSAAFKDLMGDLETSAQQLELSAAQALPESRQHFEAYFTEWQQRKLVLAWIRKRVNDQLAVKTELEERERNERTNDDDLASSGNPTGY